MDIKSSYVMCTNVMGMVIRLLLYNAFLSLRLPLSLYRQSCDKSIIAFIIKVLNLVVPTVKVLVYLFTARKFINSRNDYICLLEFFPRQKIKCFNWKLKSIFFVYNYFHSRYHFIMKAHLLMKVFSAISTLKITWHFQLQREFCINYVTAGKVYRFFLKFMTDVCLLATLSRSWFYEISGRWRWQ